jgi:spore maturation protein CgeB
MAEMGWCPSGRLFEAAACGAPMISDQWEGLDAFFGSGEIIRARNSSDVVTALESDDRELMAMARRARERVLDEHTSSKRATELIRLLECFSRSGAGTLVAEEA